MITTANDDRSQAVKAAVPTHLAEPPSNFAVARWLLADDPLIRRAGIRFARTVSS